MNQPSPKNPGGLNSQNRGYGSAIAPSAQTHSSEAALHPALQNALDCLDVDLDEELSRYRRYSFVQQRVARRRSMAAATADSRQQSIPSRSSFRSAATLSSPAMNESGAIESSTAIAATITGASSPNLADSGHPYFDHSSETTHSPNPDDYLESSAELLRSLAEEEQRAKTIAAETDTTNTAESNTRSLWASALTPLGVGSILLLILSSATLGYLILRPSTMDSLSAWFVKPNSSSQDAVAGNAESGLSSLAPNLAAGEFDPLRPNNLSSLPSFLDDNEVDPNQAVSSLVDPNNPDATSAQTNDELSLAPLTANLPGSSAIAPSTSSSAPGSVGPVFAPVSPPAVVPQSSRSSPTPRQSQPSANASSRPAPAPAISPNSNNSNSAATRTSSASDSEPSANSTTNRATTPSSTPVRANTAVAASGSETSPPPRAGSTAANGGSSGVPVSSTPVKEDLYYVTTPYTGDQSLETARDAVSGSYVRNFPDGTQVQMGAFSSQSGAEALIQNLENQGISAEIYDVNDDN